ncbi:transposase [Gemmiger formicilis]|uniref:transposase n=1 Tax=Gemmiger formicilis TaxID=745368 RepID=UPI00399486A1
MEKHAEDARRKAMVIDIDMLVPKDHLLRKIEKVMDYDWLYERLNPLYNDKVGRPGTDPVVLIKMVLIQHLFGIPSLRQTWRECDVNVAYRWFLGYDLLEHIPHFATVSYAFCNRFPAELSVEIFDHILNKALNNRMVDPSVVFIDGTHIKASANKKKFQKEQVNKAAKVYDEVLRKEVNEERAKLGKKEIEDKDDDEPPKGEKTVSTTDPDCGMFVKGEHERQFAYEAHTACERHGFVLAVEVTPGNIHDSVAWDAVYDSVCSRFPEAEALAMDAGYKTPWIARKILQDGRIPVLPYTRRHMNCPCREKCGANGKGQKLIQRHIWQEYLDVVEGIRKTDLGKSIYEKRKETIERVFADAKEKHSMRYTHMRGLARVTQWVRLKFAAMNLKKLANWAWKRLCLQAFGKYFWIFEAADGCCAA